MSRFLLLLLAGLTFACLCAPGQAIADTPQCDAVSIVEALKEVSTTTDSERAVPKRQALQCLLNQQLSSLKKSFAVERKGIVRILEENQSTLFEVSQLPNVRGTIDVDSTFQVDRGLVKIHPLTLNYVTEALFESVCERNRPSGEEFLLLESFMREGGACVGLTRMPSGQLDPALVRQKVALLVNQWEARPKGAVLFACKFLSAMGSDANEQCPDKTLNAARALFTLASSGLRFYLAHELGHVMVRDFGRIPTAGISSDAKCRNSQIAELAADRFATALSAMEPDGTLPIMLKPEASKSTSIDMYEVWTIFRRIPHAANWSLRFSLDASCPYPSPEIRSRLSAETAKSGNAMRRASLERLTRQFIVDQPIVATRIAPERVKPGTVETVAQLEAMGVQTAKCSEAERQAPRVFTALYGNAQVPTVLVVRFCETRARWRLPGMTDDLSLAGAMNAENSLRWYRDRIAEPLTCRGDLVSRLTWASLERYRIGSIPRAKLRFLPC